MSFNSFLRRRKNEKRLKKQIETIKKGEHIRTSRLEAAGVDMGIFLDAKVRKDSLAMLEEYAPAWKCLNVNIANARCTRTASNLTQTGKIPKNVLVSRFMITEEPMKSIEPNDHLCVTLKYLADGTVNMADIDLGHNEYIFKAMIRKIDGDHRITSIVRIQTLAWVQDMLYRNPKPTNKEDGVRILDNALRRTFR